MNLISKALLVTTYLDVSIYKQDPSISIDGNYVVFVSLATNFVAGDSNGFSDIYLWTRSTGNIVRASLTNLGGQPNQVVNDTTA